LDFFFFFFCLDPHVHLASNYNAATGSSIAPVAGSVSISGHVPSTSQQNNPSSFSSTSSQSRQRNHQNNNQLNSSQMNNARNQRDHRDRQQSSQTSYQQGPPQTYAQYQQQQQQQQHQQQQQQQSVRSNSNFNKSYSQTPSYAPPQQFVPESVSAWNSSSSFDSFQNHSNASRYNLHSTSTSDMWTPTPQSTLSLQPFSIPNQTPSPSPY
jgi:hypothetical protein